MHKQNYYVIVILQIRKEVIEIMKHVLLKIEDDLFGDMNIAYANSKFKSKQAYIIRALQEKVERDLKDGERK